MKLPRTASAFSWTGLALATTHAAIFVYLYVDYRRHAGAWFADLPLSLFSWPFVAAMNFVTGSSFDFAGDMTARVAAAGATDTAALYLVGWGLGRGARALSSALALKFRASSPGS